MVFCITHGNISKNGDFIALEKHFICSCTFASKNGSPTHTFEFFFFSRCFNKENKQHNSSSRGKTLQGEFSHVPTVALKI